MELLRPTVDFVFKRIFGTEENKDVLVDFLNAVFESAGQPQISTVEILNPFIDKNALYDKMSILDVRARTGSGTFINVEIQLWNRRDIEKRTLYYWAKMYSGQLQEGENYRKLNKTVTINVLDFDYISNDRYHNIFHLREDISDIVLSDNLEIHVVELRKLKEQSVGMERRLVRWMLFLSARTKERLEELAVKEPAIKKAVTTLEFLSQDEESRRLYEERQRALHDYASDIEGAREEGWERGREEGEINRARATAYKMLNAGMDVKQIAEFVDLPVEEVEKIRQQLS